MSDHKMKFETIQLHAGQDRAAPATGAKAVPIAKQILDAYYY